MQLKGKYFLITIDKHGLFEIGRRIEHVPNCNFVTNGRREKKE